MMRPNVEKVVWSKYFLLLLSRQKATSIFYMTLKLGILFMLLIGLYTCIFVVKTRKIAKITKIIEPCYLQKYCLELDIQPMGMCQSLKSTRLFVFIFSLPKNIEYRQLIRKTWLNGFKPDQLQHVFLLGYEEATKIANIKAEAKTYNDIVVVNINESFRNLTLKALTGLRFAFSICPNAKFVMKTDDDIFINMFMLQEYLSNLIKKANLKRVLMGYIWHKARVFRSGQYAVTKLQYAKSRYPSFCSGAAYIMSMDVSKLLHELAMKDKRTVLMHLDDPYLTGIIADQAKLEHIQLKRLYIWKKSNYDGFSDLALRQHLVLHLHDDHFTKDTNKSKLLHQDLWNRLVNIDKKGAKYT